MSNRYDLPITALFGLNPVEGEIGCEIEVEGTQLPGVYVDPRTGEMPVGMQSHWTIHRDGSLRNMAPGDLSTEYVLARPVPREKLDLVFNYFDKKWEEAGATSYDSYRTSVHVHLNVGAWPARKVISFLTTYYILEEVLTDWADGGTGYRVGNRFCLRAMDAEDIIENMVRWTKNNMLGGLSRDQLKYAAANVAALNVYGSLEFRALAGTVDTKRIREWIGMLLKIKDFSEKYDDPSEIIGEFSRAGPREFLDMIGLGNLWDLSAHGKLRDGMRLAQDLAYATNWQPYKAPPPAKTPRRVTTTINPIGWADEPILNTVQAPVPAPATVNFTIPLARAVTYGRPL